MKKFKLFALTALFSLMGANAFAATDAFAVKDGVWYKYDSDGGAGVGTEASPYQATVFAVKENEEGVQTLTIPASFTWVSPTEDDMYFVVVGFENAWDAQADTDVNGDTEDESFEAITFQLTSLTVNIDNFAAGAILNLVGGLKKLTSLTLIDEAKTGAGAWNPAGHTVAQLGITDVIAGKLTTLNIGRTGVTIEDDAFKAETYKNLTSITLPAGLLTIGKNAFKGFKGTTISIPNSVTTIGESAFEGAALTSVTFETLTGANTGKVTLSTGIDTKAFKGCAALTSISIPALAGAGPLAIGVSAFEGCTALATATLGSAATIGNDAFKGCTSMTEVTIPGVSTIGTGVFEGCKLLATVTISGATTAIGNDAFKGCTSLVEIDLSKTNLGDALGTAFSGCVGLTTVTLNDKVTKLVNDLFKDTQIEEINAPGTVDVGTIMGVLADDKFNTTLKKVTIGKVVDAKPLLTNTFKNCTALEEVTLGYSATFAAIDMVQEKCFLNCTALKTFNFSPTDAAYQYVNDKAFLGCSSNPLVHFVTSTIYQTTFVNAPYQTTYGNEAATTVTTKADKGTSGKFFAKYHATSPVSIDPEEAKVYSVYVDEGIAYFQALVKRGGVYVITAAMPNVIIKTDEEKEVEITPYNGMAGSSVLIDDIICKAANTTLAALQDGGEIATGQYLYRLTNNAASGGFGFTYYTGSTVKAGQFFIASTVAPAAGGRLNVVWLDEDGNVEEETTAINTIVEKAQNSDAIYNLAGQKVNANYKGVVIKNGKKVIVK